MSELTENRKWCKEQIADIDRKCLRPVSQCRGLKDFVQWNSLIGEGFYHRSTIDNQCTLVSYMDLWSWIIRNSSLKRGGLLYPHGELDLEYFDYDSRIYIREMMFRLQKYLATDGTIRFDLNERDNVYDIIYKLINDSPDRMDRNIDELNEYMASIGFIWDEFDYMWKNYETGEIRLKMMP